MGVAGPLNRSFGGLRYDVARSGEASSPHLILTSTQQQAAADGQNTALGSVQGRFSRTGEPKAAASQQAQCPRPSLQAWQRARGYSLRRQAVGCRRRSGQTGECRQGSRYQGMQGPFKSNTGGAWTWTRT